MEKQKKRRTPNQKIRRFFFRSVLPNGNTGSFTDHRYFSRVTGKIPIKLDKAQWNPLTHTKKNSRGETQLTVARKSNVIAIAKSPVRSWKIERFQGQPLQGKKRKESEGQHAPPRRPIRFFLFLLFFFFAAHSFVNGPRRLRGSAESERVRPFCQQVSVLRSRSSLGLLGHDYYFFFISAPTVRLIRFLLPSEQLKRPLPIMSRVWLNGYGFDLDILGFTGFYLLCTGFYWVLLGFTVFLTGFYWVFMGCTRFYWVVLGCNGILLDLTGFHLVL